VLTTLSILLEREKIHMSVFYKINQKLFCDLCDYLSVTSQDHQSKLSVGVCRQCELKFFQPNREKWKNGWRPTTKDINKFKKEIEKSVYSILSEINNYI